MTVSQAPARPTPAATTTRPAPKPNTKPAAPTPAAPKTFTVSTGPKKKGQRIVLYGTGGVGKTTLASLARSVRFIDIDSAGTAAMDVQRVEGIASFDDVIAALREESLWKGVDTIVVDSATKLEEWAKEWTIANITTDKGAAVKSIEGYGWGKGYSHLYDTFMLFLAAVDRHVEQGRNVILICHQVVDKVPNPAGDDYSQHQPALQKSNQGNIRSRVQGWCDHMLFVGYDVAAKDGKGIGSGTRTIQVVELPAYQAKSRTLRDPIDYPEGSDEVWRAMGIKQ